MSKRRLAVHACHADDKAFLIMGSQLPCGNGRGDWRSFEPYPQLAAPIVTVFDGLTLPFTATVQRLMA